MASNIFKEEENHKREEKGKGMYCVERRKKIELIVQYILMYAIMIFWCILMTFRARAVCPHGGSERRSRSYGDVRTYLGGRKNGTSR